MAIKGETTNNAALEKRDVQYHEEAKDSIEGTLTVGAEAEMTWKTCVVIFVSLEDITVDGTSADFNRSCRPVLAYHSGSYTPRGHLCYLR